MLGKRCSLFFIVDKEFQNFHVPSCTENAQKFGLKGKPVLQLMNSQIILLRSVILGCFGGVYAMMCCFTPDFIILLVS